MRIFLRLRGCLRVAYNERHKDEKKGTSEIRRTARLTHNLLSRSAAEFIAQTVMLEADGTPREK